ncbi:acetyl-CoA carboxylase, carboxyltransferase subunit beta [Haliovirga abyssi]|uniref:Acetyl-coenzyme A carboxylase carboxyl transferase subunit beta n=1 Tax=Haliovirga abyssi TaxID=2996794 RepID=A0AAU9DIH1_9FUSO|nr:acetyl-CoA carboxylase, carboxyltransferase subunit beta [Haliovirga abyssi]BDU50564.1 acetyl-coenzyme A carboxylase carboxyl transferase subunit beta [Haliovirga abyssi]
MGLFSNRKKYATISTKEEAKISETKNKIIDKLWIKCSGCNDIVYIKDVKENANSCPKCGFYFRMSAKERIEQLIDDETFVEYDSSLFSKDILNFPGYAEKIEQSHEKAEMNDAVISGIGNINKIKVSIAVMDFSFMGGSMGSVVGEKITRAIERSIELGIPFIAIATSGGARMQEGIFSLMQMAKTSAALERLREKGLPFISIPVNPTTGGVTASFAMLGDINISEPGALIAFAGPRVIEQTIHQKLPEGFQRSEFLLEHGMLDAIVERKEMKEFLYKFIKNLGFGEVKN